MAEIKFRPYGKLSDKELFEEYNKEQKNPTIIPLTLNALCFSITWTYQRIAFWILMVFLIFIIIFYLFNKKTSKLYLLEEEIKLRNKSYY